MTEKKTGWVVAIDHEHGRTLSFVAEGGMYLTSTLSGRRPALIYPTEIEAEHERSLLAARMLPEMRYRAQVMSYEDAVVEVTKREVTSGS